MARNRHDPEDIASGLGQHARCRLAKPVHDTVIGQPSLVYGVSEPTTQTVGVNRLIIGGGQQTEMIFPVERQLRG